jgi:hypothetical protein
MIKRPIRVVLSSKYFIRLCRHDEIVAVQTFDLVRPPLDYDPAPLGDDQRVMSLFFGDDGDLVRERNCFNKVLELEDALQVFDSVHLFDLPANDVQHQIFNFGVGQGRLAAATGDALSSRKVDHNILLVKNVGADRDPPQLSSYINFFKSSTLFNFTRNARLPAATSAS